MRELIRGLFRMPGGCRASGEPGVQLKYAVSYHTGDIVP